MHEPLAAARTRGLAVVFLGLLLARAGGSQDPVPPAIAERIDVSVVNIDVVAFGAGGTRKHGIRREDFEVLVNGVKVPIHFFDEIRDGRWIEEETARPGSELRRNILVFVDDWFPLAADRDEALRGLEDSLGLLRSADFVSLVAFDGSTLDHLTSWSNDIAKLKEGIQAARRRPAYGMNHLGNVQQRLRRRHFEVLDQIEAGIALRNRESGVMTMGEAAGGGGQLRAVRAAEGRANRASYEAHLRTATIRLADWLRRSAAAVAAAMREAQPQEGRRLLLLMAGGWPEHPALYWLNNDDPRSIDLVSSMEVGNHGGHDLLFPITHAAVTLGYTVYPVDAVGLIFQPVRELQTASSLERLAADTGGVAFLDDQRAHALAGALADSDSYYSLGVSPPVAVLDGSSEPQIRVRVARPDVARIRVARASTPSTLGSAPVRRSSTPD